MRAGGPEDEPWPLLRSIWGLILTPGAAGIVKPTRKGAEKKAQTQATGEQLNDCLPGASHSPEGPAQSIL